jgi:hypothetical protein
MVAPNIEGSHSTTVLKPWSRKGWYYGHKFGPEIQYRPVVTSRSVKSATIHSNHVSPTSYHREVRQIESDEPSVRQIVWGDARNGVGEEIIEMMPVSYDIPAMFLYPPTTSIEINVRDASITKVLNKLSGDTQVQNGADLGEARRTANALATDYSTLLRAILAARRGVWNQIPSILGISKGDILSGRFVANRWLAYQYGWKPLKQAIYDNYTLLMDTTLKDMSINVTAAHVTSYESPLESFNGLETQWSGKVIGKSGIRAKMTNEFFAGQQRLGMLNPLSVAWELMPFSFVFDWGIPVGNTLNALTASAGLQFLDGYTSVVRKSSFVARRSKATTTWLVDPGNYRMSLVSFNRDLMTSFPLPRLYGKDNPFSTRHVLNALALLRSLMG